jgi:hypothetical protein
MIFAADESVDQPIAEAAIKCNPLQRWRQAFPTMMSWLVQMPAVPSCSQQTRISEI